MYTLCTSSPLGQFSHLFADIVSNSTRKSLWRKCLLTHHFEDIYLSWCHLSRKVFEIRKSRVFHLSGDEVVRMRGQCFVKLISLIRWSSTSSCFKEVDCCFNRDHKKVILISLWTTAAVADVKDRWMLIIYSSLFNWIETEIIVDAGWHSNDGDICNSWINNHKTFSFSSRLNLVPASEFFIFLLFQITKLTFRYFVSFADTFCEHHEQFILTISIYRDFKS